MKYSVVIPLYNKQNYIQQTIESVLAQTLRDFEILVVDDGSTDRSLEIAKKFEAHNVHIITQKNAGVSVARNVGIKNANGTYVAFLDADDLWYPNYLETIDSLIEKFPQGGMYVTAYRIVMGENRYHYSARLSDEDVCIDSYWTTFKNAYDIVWTSATVIAKDLIMKAGMFTPGEKIGQDLDLWARVAKNNPKVCYSPQICVDYSRGAEQNARTRVKIAYPKAFLSVLSEEMNNSKWTEEDKKWMLHKYNKKMIVYVFTSILAGQRKSAREVLSSWKKTHYNKYIFPLWCVSFLPNKINNFIYGIRLKVF